ncbi:MAG: FGGY family carbohydrate kinase [Angelakisella sp.]|nr:FGGY family carbohydrate kinase [Angelakisella sp.]
MVSKNEKLLLGIDIGTTGTKCAIYNQKGDIVAHAYQEYAMIHPQELWTEQDPNRWWNAVQVNLKDCFTNQGINSSQIASIGLSCTNALTLVDENGNPVYNAIGHHDLRADPQVAWLKEHVGEDLVFSVTANKLDKGTFCLPSLRWLIDNRPELVEKAHKFLMPSGFIVHKLTGKFSINRPRTSLTSMADILTGEWSKEIIEKAQVPARLLPKPYSSCDIVGTVTKEAAALTGLMEGTPVSAGCLDTAVSTVGAGAIEAGDMALTLGSSGRVCYISDAPIYDKRLLNCRSPFDGRYIIIQSTDNAGISLRWFRDVFGKVAEQEAKKAGKPLYQYMDELAKASPAGAGGLLYLPYLSGEKAPIWNSKARGVFFNMGLGTGYGDFLRAVMEGVAFSMRDCISIMPGANDQTKAIPIGGGVANSRIWCQIFADVLNHPVVQLKSSETETLGDMIIAAQCVNINEVPQGFGRKMAHTGTTIYPNPENIEIYNKQFDKYKKLYSAVADLY